MTLKDMMAHEFMTMNKIPDFLPISSLVCPPSSTYTKQYLPIASNDLTAMMKSPSDLNRFEQTAPMTTAVASARIYNMNMGIA